uniref:Uncharacterized protein n=1 Tax=Anguilla anguilla TaxID=7936 RepID=A0A0E9PLY3_ANGAN
MHTVHTYPHVMHMCTHTNTYTHANGHMGNQDSFPAAGSKDRLWL